MRRQRHWARSACRIVATVDAFVLFALWAAWDASCFVRCM